MPASEALDRTLSNPGLVYLVGGLDTGKTTFALDLLQRASASGLPSAIDRKSVV